MNHKTILTLQIDLSKELNYLSESIRPSCKQGHILSTQSWQAYQEFLSYQLGIALHHGSISKQFDVEVTPYLFFGDRGFDCSLQQSS